ncbi:TPA: hypothetical protein OO086_002513 [Legionella pneumophila]|nr:hypothetical protein [Legionella pneumophila]
MKPIAKNFGVIICIGLIFLWSFIAAIERLVFLNTNSYPDFLVNQTVSLESKEKIHELIKLSCPQGGADIVERDNAYYFRCGFFWPTSVVTKVQLLHNKK